MSLGASSSPTWHRVSCAFWEGQAQGPGREARAPRMNRAFSTELPVPTGCSSGLSPHWLLHTRPPRVLVRAVTRGRPWHPRPTLDPLSLTLFQCGSHATSGTSGPWTETRALLLSPR